MRHGVVASLVDASASCGLGCEKWEALHGCHHRNGACAETRVDFPFRMLSIKGLESLTEVKRSPSGFMALGLEKISLGRP
jgi:hypothetical protein